MLEASRVYSFKKDGELVTLFVDSVRRKSEYWLEVKTSNGEEQISDKVYSWNEAVGLLEEQDWTRYEMVKMDFSFTDRILEAKGRKKTKAKSKRYNAQQRVLEILKRLQRNETIEMENSIKEFGISRTMIQRDIKAINEFFAHSNKEVEYVRGKKGYDLSAKGDYFTIDDALFVLIFLYGSRALNKEELKGLSDKIIDLFSKAEQIKLREFFKSYLFHYHPVQEQNLFELFYMCFQAISQKRILKFAYTNNAGQTNIREVVPLTISYHDRKFYLIARRKGYEDGNPSLWQMDRIEDCKITNQKFLLSPSDANVGEFLQQAFFMHSGDLQKVRLRVKESNLPYLKRQFPLASIKPATNSEWFDVRLEVRGLAGINLWVLQQGQYVEVIEPMELREKVKADISQMYQMYFETANVK